MISTLSAFEKQQDEPFVGFGFKHPRTSFTVPYFAECFPKGTIRFVHVIRDGRCVTRGDNRNQFKGLCSAYYGESCEAGNATEVTKRYEEFWSDANYDVFQAAKRMLGPENYYAIRTEGPYL
jgi:hypothetical protein